MLEQVYEHTSPVMPYCLSMTGHLFMCPMRFSFFSKPSTFTPKALLPALSYPLAKQGVFTSATPHLEPPGNRCRPDFALDGHTGAGMDDEATRTVTFCTTNNVGPPWFRLDMRVSLRVVAVSLKHDKHSLRARVERAAASTSSGRYF